MGNSSPKARSGRPVKRISSKEKEWCDIMVDHGLGPIEAARKTWGLRYEPNSSDSRKVINLTQAPRIKKYLATREEQIVRETEATKLVLNMDSLNWDQLRKFCYDRLIEVRDNDNLKASVRFQSIKALEQITDPSSDTNLILIYLNLLWQYGQAHCPCCHTRFNLSRVKNPSLDQWREQYEVTVPPTPQDDLMRRIGLISKAEPRRTPHPGQIRAIAAKERHIAATGPARSGKSFLLATMALLAFMIPGVEIWILARIYEDARSEVEYLERFLNALFHPYTRQIIQRNYDSKSGELVLKSRWGSELKIRSAKAKGSITGRELEMALVAEPGWVPEDLFEELRARMSSRLGRIVMMGTPKGFGGILGRVVNLTARDPKTGRIVKVKPEDRLIENGSAWNISANIYTMNREDNPEYVKSEGDAARAELTQAEFEAEFEGLMTSQEGSKFPQIKMPHLVHIPKDLMLNCVFVLGIDQGPKNFAATLMAFNGEDVFVLREYFESDSQTMKKHLQTLKRLVPGWITQEGGDPDAWLLTILDADPPLDNELTELEEEGEPWPTEVTLRPKNQNSKYMDENWRESTYEFVNTMASQGKLTFHIEHCSLLHDQLIRAQNRPPNRDTDSGPGKLKGWVISDPWRGDHVCDAFILSMWTILNGELEIPEVLPNAMDPWAEHEAAFKYKLRVSEAAELSGWGGGRVQTGQIFEDAFGRNRGGGSLTRPGYYKDES